MPRVDECPVCHLFLWDSVDRLIHADCLAELIDTVERLETKVVELSMQVIALKAR